MAKINNADTGSAARQKINALIALPLSSVSASKTLNASDMQTRQRVTTGSSDVTLTLPTASSYTGEAVWIDKVDSGTGKVIVGSDLAHLYAIGDRVCVQSNGSTWDVIDARIAPLVQTYNASATWTKPPLARSVFVQLVGAGAGGGSGTRTGDATGTFWGGSGGASAGYSEITLAASLLGATETVTIGAGGAGGAALTTNGSPNAGSAGGTTSFGSQLRILGASPAPGGEGRGSRHPSWGMLPGCNGADNASTAPGSSTAGVSTTATAFAYTNASHTNSTNAGNTGATVWGYTTNIITGGGGGGTNNHGAPGCGGASGGAYHGTITTGGAGGGTTNGASGAAGGSASLTGVFTGGAGGGGGAPGLTTTAGSGGAGGWPGGGGGGGGIGFSSNTSGAGGKGGDGGIRVTTYF